jgi:hypothetical protein
MTALFALLPLYLVIGVVGMLLIGFYFLVQAVVRISHSLTASAAALQEIALSLRKH